MTRPTLYLIRMALFLAAIAALAVTLRPMLLRAFLANPGLDSVILAVLLIGILWNLRIVQRLMPEVRWAELLRQPRTGLGIPPAPHLLAPIAGMLAAQKEQGGRLSLSPQVTSAMLDSLGARLDEGREISRYMTQLLVFLGLLGTFYGLLLTVNSIASVISGMSVSDDNLNAMFDQLKTGLAGPLAGMSTAFSGSMFGLAGALVLGFLDLTAGQAQTRFFNELEEWLSSFVRLGTTAEGGARDPRVGGPAYEAQDGADGVYAQTLDTLRQNLATLQDMFVRTEENHLRQIQILEALQRVIVQTAQSQAQPADDAPLARIEQHMDQMREELRYGRTKMLADLRRDLHALTRTVADGKATSSGKQG